MPWKECGILDQRTEFVLRSLGKNVSLVGLCQEYGISRKTGYKWRERFIQEGLGGLHDDSRRPHSSPGSLSEEQICEIIKFKGAHPHWGPYKLRQLYLRKHGEAPSDSSFKRVLDKAGLVKHRRLRKIRSQPRITTELEVCQPNDVWTVDFKGWWKTLGGGRCEPLTVRDLHSKYMLSVKAMESTRTEQVKAEFEHLFSRYGLPKVILSDNGPPFAVSHALLGLSTLAIWWIAQGVRLHRIRPSSPQENGSHERMHRDIKGELQGRVEGDSKEQQASFDIWRKEYNEVRPHEALSMKVPAEVYCKSDRSWNGNVDQLTYGEGFLTRTVTKDGSIGIEGCKIGISRTLTGWDVGLKYIDESNWEVWFDYLRLGEIDLTTEQFTAADKTS